LQDITHPDDRDVSDAYFHRLLAGELDEYAMDKRYLRKDGSPIWVHVAVALVRTRAGAPDYTISMIQDITDRKRLEQERAHLLEREHAARAEAEAALDRAIVSEALATERAERLNTILETEADGVIVYDRCGGVVQSNRAYHEMLATERIPGFDALPRAERAHFFDLHDAATGEPVPLAHFPTMRALRGEVVTRPEADHRIHALDGRELEVSISAAPLRDGGRRIVGAVLVMRDQTERKRLEREREEARAHELALRELDQRKDEFLNILGHEIQTPLSSVQGYIQLLILHFNAERTQRRGKEGEEEEEGAVRLMHDIALARSALANSEASIKRLTRLANDLIDDVQIRDGRLTVRRTACELGAIVRASVEEQRMLEANRTIHLELPTAQAVPVIADADRIAQVVTNYLTNALKYSKEDRPIAVRLEVEREMAQVSVRDGGPGLSLSDKMHLFERFPRIKGTAVQSGSGVSLGLGLHICKAIVEAHGGRVGLESVPGRGSTFWFTLPLAPPPDAGRDGGPP